MGRVFISHSSKDDAFVDKLVADLNRQQIETFVDHHDIHFTQRWNAEVAKALKTCDQMIAVISPDSIESKNCQDEWHVFMNAKEIIPAWLSGNEMYFGFATAQYVDFRQQYDQSLVRLVRFLTDAVQQIVPASESKNAQPAATLASRLGERYPLIRRLEKAIGIAHGNIAELAGADVLVNSENDFLEMDRISGRSVSAALNAFGAKWDEKGRLVEQTVKRELEAEVARLGLDLPAPPATVVVTSAGAMQNIGVRHVLHTVSVISTKNQGYKNPTRVQLARCVTNTLLCVDQLNRERYPDQPLKRVVFPFFGTGASGLAVEVSAPLLIERAVDYLETQDTQIETAYFVAHLAPRLELLKGLLDQMPDLGAPFEGD